MFSGAAEVARMVFPVEFTRKRPIDLDEYHRNISNAITYKRPKFNEEYDLSRRYDTSFPQGFQVQTWGNSIDGPPFTRIDPNHDFAKTIPPEFQHPSPVFLSRYDVVSSQFNVPGRDLLKRYDAASSHFQNPNRDFSRRYNEVSPRFQNPSHDHSRKCESSSHRFQARRNENPEKGPIVKKNLTHDFSRGGDSGSSRFQARSKVPKEGPISKMIPTGHISRKCSTKRKKAKVNQTCDFSRKSDSVSLRFQTRTCEKPKGGSIAKVNPTHDISRKCDSVSAQFQVRNSEKPKGGLIAKMNPTHDISRKCDNISPRFQARASEKPKDRSIAKVKLSGDVLRKCDSISPQFQGTTNEKPKEKSVAKVNPTSDLSRKCEYVTPQSLAETSENLKDGLLVKVNSTHDYARKCDADSSRVEVKASENSKEGSVKKVNPTNDSSRKCVAISLPVEAKTSEIPDQAKPSEVLVTGVTKFGPAKSTVSRDKFKIQKVNAVRDFPKHCGALAPRITIESSGKNLVSINKNSLKASNISSSGLPKSENTLSKVEKDNIEGIKPGLRVDDVEVVLSKLKVDNLENMSNDPILSNGIEKVLNDVLSGVPKSENTMPKVVNYNFEGINPGLKVHDGEEVANELKVDDVKKVFSEPILQNGAEKMLDEVISSSGVPKSVKTISKVVNGNIEGNKPGLKVDDVEDVVNELEVDDMEKVFIHPTLPSGTEEVLNEVILSNDVEKLLNVPISTNAPEENFARAKSVDSKSRPLGNGFSVIQDYSQKCSILKDHAFDPMDDVASIGEQSQSGGLFEGDKTENVLEEKMCDVRPKCAQLGANKSLECEDEEDRLEKGNSPIYPSGIDSSFFEKHHEGVCSEYDVDMNDTAFLYNSDLWPNQDKVEPVGQSSKERPICPFLDADAENHKNFNDLSIIPFGECEAVSKRKDVKEAIDSYGRILAKLLEDNEAAESSGKGKVSKQVHIEAAMLLKKEKQWINTEQVLGHVPGIEVGDRFRFRAELVCIGLHRLFQNGIDYMRGKDGKILATSIVSSGRYANDAEFPDVLQYSGQGGNATNGNSKHHHDQKLVRGNLALKNSMEAKTPVRVIRKNMNSVLKYYYDGLYVVTEVTQERSQYGKLVYMFQLNRIAQLERLPYLVEDISQGKEKIPIHVVNTVDDENFPFFNYIAGMIYPESCNRSLSGCDCTNGCSELKKCLCASKNGGEFPFSDSSTIIVRPKSKRFIYECGPSCKCPTSCKNRVSQYGIRYQLEVFKTESMGWGVRSCNYIPAGSFICEYVGELLQDLEAEQRTRNDEYLFDIDNDGFTIDAAKYGNVGRFINHSCSPNLYAQNVLYDHDNKRMPHVMFFTVNSISPFQELTYDYNYKVDQVRDGDGNIKKKACHCSSRCCRGRLY